MMQSFSRVAVSSRLGHDGATNVRANLKVKPGNQNFSSEAANIILIKLLSLKFRKKQQRAIHGKMDRAY